MSFWNPYQIACENCEYPMLRQIEQIDIEKVSKHNGELVLWCPDCGTLLCANQYDPISSSDWRVPKLSELNLTGNPTSRRA